MKTPGFTAEASLHKGSGYHHPLETRAYNDGGQNVMSQLSVGRFPGSHGVGVFSGIGDWLCRVLCELSYSACLDGCEGTLDNPKPSSNCTICDQQHTACLQGCGGSNGGPVTAAYS